MGAGVKLKIAVLGDGGGLARLGLERAGHTCTGFELDPAKHYLSQMVGSGNCILADMREVDLSAFDAVWVSPPCQEHSQANNGSNNHILGLYSDGSLLDWCLTLPHEILWVENVINPSVKGKYPLFNAAQFLPKPIQSRPRFIAGRYRMPMVYRSYQYTYPKMDICPTIMASQWRDGKQLDKLAHRSAPLWYGRPLSIHEMAYHQGFDIPDGLLKSWFYIPPFDNQDTGKPYTFRQWRNQMKQTIGNGVPVYMAQAFGAAYTGQYTPADIYPLRMF